MYSRVNRFINKIILVTASSRVLSDKWGWFWLVSMVIAYEWKHMLTGGLGPRLSITFWVVPREFYPPLLSHHQGKCQHRDKGPIMLCLYVIMEILLSSQTSHPHSSVCEPLSANCCPRGTQMDRDAHGVHGDTAPKAPKCPSKEGWTKMLPCGQTYYPAKENKLGRAPWDQWSCWCHLLSDLTSGVTLYHFMSLMNILVKHPPCQ